MGMLSILLLLYIFNDGDATCEDRVLREAEANALRLFFFRLPILAAGLLGDTLLLLGPIMGDSGGMEASTISSAPW